MEWSAVIIGAIVYVGVIIAFGIFFVYFIHRYQDPEDLPDFFTKFVTWLTYLTTTAAILLLPFDVICAPDSHKFMPIVWQIFMGVIAIEIIALVPFTMCYYEQSGNIFNKIYTGLMWMVGSILVWAIIIVVLWATIGTAEIPITSYLGPLALTFEPTTAESLEAIKVLAQTAADTEEDTTIDISCSFIVYAVCILSVLGWVFFLVFGGGGMFTLPFDWILSCIFRPRIPRKSEFVNFKAGLKRDTEKLLQIIDAKKKECTERIASDSSDKKSWSRKERKELKNLRLDVQDVIDDYDHVRYVSQPNDYNVLAPYCKFIFGIFFLLLSIVLVVQLLLVLILGEGHFLSDAFVAMDDYIPFLGAGFYGIFVLYLAVATIKGSVKIGTKFLLFEFYPMNEKATLPNAMLFNGMLYMFSSLALMQFANSIFTSYTYNTAVNGMFTGQMKNLMGLKYLFRYLHYVFLGFVFLGLIWSITFQCCIACCDRKKKEKKLRLVNHRR